MIKNVKTSAVTVGKINVVMNWSGGKDSSLALHRLLQNPDYQVKSLLTTVNEMYQRVSMHGVRTELLEQQADSLGIPLRKVWLSEIVAIQTYSEIMQQTLEGLKIEAITHAAFGDIFLKDLKKYRENQLAIAGFKGLFPIWQENPRQLMDEFIVSGFKAVVVCVNEKYLAASFAGRLIDRDFVKDLPAGVDICGENGEYHSFVFDGPIFKKPISFTIGEKVRRSYTPVSTTDTDIGTTDTSNCYRDDADKAWDTGFWYQDLLPA